MKRTPERADELSLSIEEFLCGGVGDPRSLLRESRALLRICAQRIRRSEAYYERELKKLGLVA